MLYQERLRRTNIILIVVIVFIGFIGFVAGFYLASDSYQTRINKLKDKNDYLIELLNEKTTDMDLLDMELQGLCDLIDKIDNDNREIIDYNSDSLENN